MDVVGVDTKHENEGRESKWEREEESRVTIPSPPFIGEVGEEILFMSSGGVHIYKNVIKGY